MPWTRPLIINGLTRVKNLFITYGDAIDSAFEELEEKADVDQLETRLVKSTPVLVSKSTDQAVSAMAPTEDINDLSITFTSPGTSAVFVVECGLDVQHGGDLGTVVVVDCVLDGSARTGSLLMASAGAVRIPFYKKWVITGVPAGVHTVKMTMWKTGSAYVSVNGTHSTLLVWVPQAND